MSLRRAVPFSLVFVLAVCCYGLQESPQQKIDDDRDGIPDALEQALLDKFRPTFLVSQAECDQLPSSFKPNVKDPSATARDGRIYGQVFRPATQLTPEITFEIHYFHLWSRDCGRMGHDFDVEHVSVLASAPSFDASISDWRALYWYAAAHEDTICDTSRWFKAEILEAVQNGPKVWISAGKHASYLSEQLCRGGCGGDQCENSRPIPSGQVTNIGEIGAPLNGALWNSSRKWLLWKKMSSDFPETALASLKTTPVTETKRVGSMQAIILGSGDAMAGLAIGGEHAAGGVNTGKKHTGRAIGTAYRSVKKALIWTFRGGKKASTSASDSPVPAKSEGDE